MDVMGLPLRLTAMAAEQRRHFKTFGFLQTRQVLEETHLDAIIRDYHRVMSSKNLRLPFNELGQLPAFVASCMTEVSPSVIGLATSEDTMSFTESLLGHPVICVHAFAYQRSEGTRWHSDNIDAKYRGLKLYLNLDAVNAENGALRVIVGTHHKWMRHNLIPKRYQTAEQQFGLAADQMPATILSSQPGDVNAFDLRIWHAVCGSNAHRRVIELTYYEVPKTASERAGFIAQMHAHQCSARMRGVSYYPQSWRGAGGPRHKRGLEVLAELDLLETGPSEEGP